MSGLPRSGTSMLMQMLANGGLPLLVDDLRAADDDNPRGYFEYTAATRLQHDQAWLSTAVGRAVKIVAHLLPSLPRHHVYRVIFVERDLREVLASQQVMLERRGRTGARLAGDQLRVVFETDVRRVKQWLAAQPNIHTLFVQHRDVLADPERSAWAIHAFLGGGLDPTAIAAAVDATLYRQRQCH